MMRAMMRRRVSESLTLCENYSFAPMGLGRFPLSAQGLRPGLHSDAASRLKASVFCQRKSRILVRTRVLKPESIWHSDGAAETGPFSKLKSFEGGQGWGN